MALIWGGTGHRCVCGCNSFDKYFLPIRAQAGPQLTLYVPGPVLREGSNELVLLEVGATPSQLQGTQGLASEWGLHSERFPQWSWWVHRSICQVKKKQRRITPPYNHHCNATRDQLCCSSMALLMHRSAAPLAVAGAPLTPRTVSAHPARQMLVKPAGMLLVGRCPDHILR